MFVYKMKHGEAYIHLSIDPRPCRKNPIKKINLSYQNVSLGEVSLKKKRDPIKVCLENCQKCFERKQTLKKNI